MWRGKGGVDSTLLFSSKSSSSSVGLSGVARADGVDMEGRCWGRGKRRWRLLIHVADRYVYIEHIYVSFKFEHGASCP